MKKNEPDNTKPKPDYARIFFIGIPLMILCWFFIVLLLTLTPISKSSLFQTSIILTILLSCIYVTLTLKYPSGFSNSEQKNSIISRSKLNKPLSKKMLVFSIIMIVTMLAVAAIGELHFHVSGLVAIKMMWPIWAIFFIAERIIKKKEGT